jgi:prepilin-type N-terminal cleavage/methylation domain-containing protein
MMIIRQKGFTLIELIIVIVILGIIGVVGSKLLVQGLNSTKTEQNVTDALWQGQLSIERMARDIRQVRSANDITTRSASDLAFTDIGGNAIEYQLSGTDLLRNTQTIGNGVSALAFTYKDNNNTTVNSGTSTIAYIIISLTITQNNTNFTLTSAVYLRDLSS